MLYNDCSELPLWNWIKIAVTADLVYLVKEGSFNNDRLQDHYEAIKEEYTTLVKDTRSTQELKTKISLTQLANRIDHVNTALHILRTSGFDVDVIALLRGPLPYGLGFARLDYKDLERDIKLTESYLQMDVVKFNQRKADLDKLTKSAEGAVNNEGSFYEEISYLSKWLGFGINPRECTLIQYISYLNALKLEIKSQQNT